MIKQPDLSDSKANNIHLSDRIRGNLEELVLIQRNTDKSSILHIVIIMDLNGYVDQENIKELEEKRFNHFCNIKKAIEEEKQHFI